MYFPAPEIFSIFVQEMTYGKNSEKEKRKPKPCLHIPDSNTVDTKIQSWLLFNFFPLSPKLPVSPCEC